MKLEIETSVKAIECANCILGQAVDILLKSEQQRKQLGLSLTDVKNALAFKNSLLKSFLNKS
jgi:ABC-type cobalamin transport system permease subunit